MYPSLWDIQAIAPSKKARQYWLNVLSILDNDVGYIKTSNNGTFNFSSIDGIVLLQLFSVFSLYYSVF